MRSAEEAGFEVLQVISEPSAAVLAYGVGLSNLDEEQYVISIYKFLTLANAWETLSSDL
jgi:molecular chaperone DnaK (HSP70)